MNLGISDRDFWRLSFYQFDEMAKAYKVKNYIERLEIGKLHVTVFNMFSKKKIKLIDILGESPIKRKVEKVQEKESMLEQFKQIFPTNEMIAEREKEKRERSKLRKAGEL